MRRILSVLIVAGLIVSAVVPVCSADEGDWLSGERWSASVKYWYAVWHVSQKDQPSEDETGTGMLGAQVRYSLNGGWSLAASALYGEFDFSGTDIPRWDVEGAAVKGWRLENGSLSAGLGWRLWHIDSPVGFNIMGVKDDPNDPEDDLEIVYGPMLYVGMNHDLGQGWGIYGAFSLQPYLWMESTAHGDEKDQGEGYNVELGISRFLENGQSVDLGYRAQHIRGSSSAVEHVDDWFHGVIASYNF